MLKRTLGALALIATLGMAVSTQAGPCYNGPCNPGFNPHAYGRPLTPEQMAEAQQIFNETNADMEITRQKLAAKRTELNQVLSLPMPDRGKIESLSREIGELRGQMLAARAEARNRLAQKGLPATSFAPAPQGYGPCWGGNGMMNWGMMNRGMMGWDGANGWRHHGRHRPHGPRGGYWQ